MKSLIITFIISFATLSIAQQDPMFTQFFSNKIVVNPAYAGTRDAISVNGLYRNQWTGFDGAPKTTTLSIHSPITKYNMGLGLSLIHDQIGIQRNYSLKLAYAYRIQTTIGKLSLGVDAEVKKQDMLWQQSNPLEVNDFNIPYGQNSLTLPNFGFGAYLYKKNYYIGISAPKLLENATDYQIAGGNSFQRRHYFAMAGVLFPFSKTFALKPAVLAKYQPNSPFEMDFNVMAIFHEVLRIGATVRTNDSFDMLVQFHMKNNVRFGYSYDFTLTELTRASTGSHEIMIGYDFNISQKGVYNPRYF